MIQLYELSNNAKAQYRKLRCNPGSLYYRPVFARKLGQGHELMALSQSDYLSKNDMKADIERLRKAGWKRVI